MAYATQFEVAINSDARYAMDKYGLTDPNEFLRDIDVDIAAIEAFLADLEAQSRIVTETAESITATQPANWSGPASQVYLGCGMNITDYLKLLTEKILWVIEYIVMIINYFTEIIRWVARLVSLIMSAITVVGWIEKGLDKLGIRLPGWLKKIVKGLKIAEKFVRIGFELVTAIAWVAEKLLEWIDGLLDDLREGIYNERLKLRNCLDDIEAPVPDEPIEPIPKPDWLP